MQGSCLCGAVSFVLAGSLPPIYQCHCSLCRQVSGSSSNSALIIERENFTWFSGEQHIKSYMTQTGFKSDFCVECGSPVPNLSADETRYWVPAGLLSEPVNSEVMAHVYVDSRANWDKGLLTDSIAKFAKMPSDEEWSTLCKHFHSHKNKTK
ncbi:GFA family protein [Shewanella waksmanii]|uniref:GFA family protein n=1 Tax=Shewanella waksmanii TaxID=213783 RepID=UPI003735E528